MADEKRYRVIIDGDASPLIKAGKEADAVVDKINNNEVEVNFNLDKSSAKVSAFLDKLQEASKQFKKENEITVAQINMDRLDALETKLETIKKLQEDLSGNDVNSKSSLGLQESQNVRKRLQEYEGQLKEKKDNPLEYSKTLREAISYIENIPEEIKSRYGKLIEGIQAHSKGGILGDFKPEDLLGIDPKLLEGDRKDLEKAIKQKTDSLIKKTENDIQQARKDYAKAPSDSLPKAHENRMVEAEKRRVEAEAKAREEAERKVREAEQKAREEAQKKEEQAREEQRKKDEQIRKEAESVQKRKEDKKQKAAPTDTEALDNIEKKAEKATKAVQKTQEAVKELNKEESKAPKKEDNKTEQIKETAVEAEGKLEELNKSIADTPKIDSSAPESVKEVGNAAADAVVDVEKLKAEIEELKALDDKIAQEGFDFINREGKGKFKMSSILDDEKYELYDFKTGEIVASGTGKELKSGPLKGSKFKPEYNEWWTRRGNRPIGSVKKISGELGELEQYGIKYDEIVAREHEVIGQIRDRMELLKKASQAESKEATTAPPKKEAEQIKEVGKAADDASEKVKNLNNAVSETPKQDGSASESMKEVGKSVEQSTEASNAQQKVADAATEASNAINQMNDSVSDGSVEQQAEKNAEAINKEKEAVEELTAAKKEAEQTSSKAKSDEQVKTNEKIASSTEETTEAIKEQDEAYKTYQYHVSRQSLDKFGVATDKKGMESDRSMSYDEVMDMLKKGVYKYDPNTMRWRSPMKDDLLIEKNPKTNKTGNKKKDAMARWAETGLLTDQGYIEPERYHVMFEAQQKSAQEAAEAAEKEAAAEREKANATKESTKANEAAVETEKKKESAVESGTKKKDKDKNPPTKYDLRSYGIDSETGEARQIRSLGDLSRKEVDDFLGVAKWNDKHQMWVAPNGKYAYESFDSKGKRRVATEKGVAVYRDSDIEKTAEERAAEILKNAVNKTADAAAKQPQMRKADLEKLQKQTQETAKKATEKITKEVEEEIFTTENGDRWKWRKSTGRGRRSKEFERQDGSWKTLDEIASEHGIQKATLNQRMRIKGLSLEDAINYTGKRGRKSGQIASTEGSGTGSAKEAVKSKGKNVRRVDRSLSAEDLIAREQALEAAEESIKRQAKAAGEVITGVTNFYDSADNLVKQQVKTRGLDVDDAMNAVIQNKTYTSEYGVDTGEAFTYHIDSKTKADPKQIDMLRELGDVLTSDQALFDRFGESYREFYDKVLGGDMSGANKLGKDLTSQIETYQGIEKQSEAIRQFGEELQKDDGIFREFGDQYNELLNSVTNAKNAKDLDSTSKAFEKLKSQVSDKRSSIKDMFAGATETVSKIGSELSKNSDLVGEFGTEWQALLSRFSSGNLDSDAVKILSQDLDRFWDKVQSRKNEKAFDSERILPRNTVSQITEDLEKAGVSVDQFNAKLKDKLGFDLEDIKLKIDTSTAEEGLGNITKMISAVRNEASREIKSANDSSKLTESYSKQAEAIEKLGDTIKSNETLSSEFTRSYENLIDRLNESTSSEGLKDIEKEFDVLNQKVKERQKQLAEQSKPDKYDQNLSVQMLSVSDELLKYEERAEKLGDVVSETREKISAFREGINLGSIDPSNLHIAVNYLKEINSELTQAESNQKLNNNRLVHDAQSGLKFLNSRDTTKYTKEMYDEMDRLRGLIKDVDLSNIDFGDTKAVGNIKEFVSGIELLETALKSLDNQVAKTNSIKNLDKQMAQFAEKNHRLTQEMTSDIQRYRDMLKKDGLTKGEYNNIFGMFRELESGAIDQGLVGGVSALENLGNRIKQMNTNFIGMYFSFYDIVRYAKEIGQSVTEINSAQTELRKVSDASQTRIQENFKTSAETAQEMGATISDVINSTSDWARLGYSVDEAEVLARNTALYQTVGDNMTQESASEYMTSIMKGYQYDADQSESIIDKVNEVANNYSIDTQGLGEALQRSASAFNTAHTDLDKSIAIITASNEVLNLWHAA